MAFDDDLARLCTRELTHARLDPKRGAEYVELLAKQLGLGLAIISTGDANVLAELLEGVTAYVFETAADKAPFAQFMAQHVRPR